jgi:glycosyltransferase involved in cell wall biosynthesis
MKPKLLLFYPHNPFSPKHGSHLRCLQQLVDLSSQYNIVFASSLATSDSEWPRNSQLDELGRREKICKISIFEYSLFGYACRLNSLAVRVLLLVLTRPICERVLALVRRFYHLAWFSYLAFRFQPEAVIVHYTDWSYLSCCIGGGVRVLELHDLLPVNYYLAKAVVDSLQGSKPGGPHSEHSSIGYIDHVAQLPQSVLDEVKCICSRLNQYDLVWMISQRETNLLRELGMNSVSDVIYPVTKASSIHFEKELPPILPIGPNPFNTYGLTKFVDDVIPLLDSQLLEHLEIQVTGRFWRDHQLDLAMPLKYYGIVDDYAERLSRSSFMIAPTSVGTGQQIKIFEALGAATPVVVYRSSIPTDVLNEYPSIVAVDSPRDFAATINKLLSDSDLLRHYWHLAQDAARRQASYGLQLPYCHSLKTALSESSRPRK